MCEWSDYFLVSRHLKCQSIFLLDGLFRSGILLLLVGTTTTTTTYCQSNVSRQFGTLLVHQQLPLLYLLATNYLLATPHRPSDQKLTLSLQIYTHSTQDFAPLAPIPRSRSYSQCYYYYHYHYWAGTCVIWVTNRYGRRKKDFKIASVAPSHLRDNASRQQPGGDALACSAYCSSSEGAEKGRPGLMNAFWCLVERTAVSTIEKHLGFFTVRVIAKPPLLPFPYSS